MALQKYAYTARSTGGEVRKGTISAESEAQAARRLQSMGLAPISIRSNAGKGATGRATNARKRRRSSGRVKSKHLAIFSRQFATMIDAGLPLVRSLAAMADQDIAAPMTAALPQVKADVEAGQAFSVALAKHPRVFPALMVGMVAAGEVSGSLGGAMNQVAQNYEKEAKLRSKVFSAMLYPMVVGGLALAMVAIMLIFVVPKFVEIFANLGGELPLPTQMLMLASKALTFFALPGVVGIAVFLYWWRRHKNDKNIRRVIDPIKMKVPVFGKFFRKIALARFARTFSTLLISGVPMLQTLEITAASAGSLVVSDALDEVRDAVRQGRTVASVLDEQPIFDPLLARMVATGEETGALPIMLTKAADFYENEVDTMADSLSSILEPIMIVSLAGIVGGMVVALYLPMFKVFDLIK